eukprot:PhM_4_TR3472/c5_g2_i1/m.77859
MPISCGACNQRFSTTRELWIHLGKPNNNTTTTTNNPGRVPLKNSRHYHMRTSNNNDNNNTDSTTGWTNVNFHDPSVFFDNCPVVCAAATRRQQQQQQQQGFVSRSGRIAGRNVVQARPPIVAAGASGRALWDQVGDWLDENRRNEAELSARQERLEARRQTSQGFIEYELLPARKGVLRPDTAVKGTARRAAATASNPTLLSGGEVPAPGTSSSCSPRRRRQFAGRGSATTDGVAGDGVNGGLRPATSRTHFKVKNQTLSGIM